MTDPNRSAVSRLNAALAAAVEVVAGCLILGALAILVPVGIGCIVLSTLGRHVDPDDLLWVAALHGLAVLAAPAALYGLAYGVARRIDRAAERGGREDWSDF